MADARVSAGGPPVTLGPQGYWLDAGGEVAATDPSGQPQITPGMAATPSSAIYYDAARDLNYNLVNGKKQYQAPVQYDPSTGRSVQLTSLHGKPISDTGGGLLHGQPTWNPDTGKFDIGLDWGKVGGLAVGGLLGYEAAPYLFGAGGAPAGGTGEAPTLEGVGAGPGATTIPEGEAPFTGPQLPAGFTDSVDVTAPMPPAASTDVSTLGPVAGTIPDPGTNASGVPNTLAPPPAPPSQPTTPQPWWAGPLGKDALLAGGDIAAKGLAAALAPTPYPPRISYAGTSADPVAFMTDFKNKLDSVFATAQQQLGTPARQQVDFSRAEPQPITGTFGQTPAAAAASQGPVRQPPFGSPTPSVDPQSKGAATLLLHALNGA